MNPEYWPQCVEKSGEHWLQTSRAGRSLCQGHNLVNMHGKDCIRINLRAELAVLWKRATKDGQPLISMVMVDQRSTLSV